MLVEVTVSELPKTDISGAAFRGANTEGKPIKQDKLPYLYLGSCANLTSLSSINSIKPNILYFSI